MKKIVLLVMVFAASFVSVSIGMGERNAVFNETPADEASVELVGEISPVAKVIWRTRCLSCGHCYTFEDNEDAIGLTREELGERFPDWKIEMFSRRLVVITRTIPGYCPDHFVLRLEGEKLRVLRAAEPELRLLTVMRQDASPYSFDDQTRALLVDGLAFPSLMELDDFVSGFQIEPSE